MAETSASSTSQPKCARCRNHGISINIKGHRRFCPYAYCNCPICEIMEESRSVIVYEYLFRSVEYECQSEPKNKCVQTESYWDVDVSWGNLSKDLVYLFYTGLYHDVEIKYGDYSIKAHKIVLCARSKVFNAMLHSDMREGGTSVVQIQPVDGVVQIQSFGASFLHHFVRYLYTDDFPDLNFEMAGFLYEIGDMYGVKSLMRRCAVYFQENLSSENIFECFALADAHSDQELKNEVIAFILGNNLHSIWWTLYQHYPSIDEELQALSQEYITKNHRYVQTIPLWNVDESQGSLSKDFSILLDKEVDSDVEIKCGEEIIKAHKIVLCARSDKLRTQIQDEMLDDRNRVIEIQDIDFCYLKDFVRYLYTDRLPELTWNKAVILCKTGVKYGVKSLVNRCSVYLQDNVPEKYTYERLKLPFIFQWKAVGDS